MVCVLSIGVEVYLLIGHACAPRLSALHIGLRSSTEISIGG